MKYSSDEIVWKEDMSEDEDEGEGDWEECSDEEEDEDEEVRVIFTLHWDGTYGLSIMPSSTLVYHAPIPCGTCS